MKTNPQAGVAMVLAAAALWGTTGTAQTFASNSLSAGWFGALRLVVAAAFFAGYAWLTQRDERTRHEAGLPLGSVLGAGLCMAVYNLAFFAGVRLTGVALGTAVALGSGPVWAGILQSLITRQVPGFAWWTGTAIAVTGGVLMTVSNGLNTADISVTGIALCLLSGLSYAAYTLFNKGLVRLASAATVTFRSFSVAAILAAPAAWLDTGAPVMAPSDWWAVMYVGVVTAGVSYLLFSHALRHISAATGVTLALAEPVMAFALAILVVGERPSWLAFAGLAFVIIGVLNVVRAELRAPPEKPHLRMT
jgi:DME family drug/metabolite transporter